jgi:hypothetical protein
MKATKQGSTRVRKRSAERQPSASAPTPRSRRSGVHEAKPHSRPTGAQPSKANGASSNESSATEKRTPKARSSAPAKGTRATATPRPRSTKARTAETTRRRTRTPDKAATRRAVAPKPSPAETPRANATPTLTAEAARTPVTSVYGAADEGPPTIDSAASAPATLAPVPRPLGRRLFEGAFGLPVRLLRSVGKSVGAVRAAYDKRVGRPVREGAGALGWLAMKLSHRTG